MVVASNHQYMLFFTEKGKCFWLRVFEIPEGSKTSKGRAIQNLIAIEPDDRVRAYIRTHDLMDEEYVKSRFVVMLTKEGQIKKTSLEAYSRPRANGINAISIRENDELLEAKLTDGNNQIMIAAKGGKAIRFHESNVRAMGRTASGVRGIRLDKKDEAIGMVIVADTANDTILVVSEKGYGKRTDVEDYRETNRGGKGVITLNITEKTGNLIALKNVTDENDLMIINKSGVTIRTSVSALRVMGRATQGVKLINLKSDDEIAAVAKVEIEHNEDLNEEDLNEENENSMKSDNFNEEE